MDRKKLLRQASTALSAQDFNQAKALLARALKEAPNDVEATALEVELRLRTGEPEQALKLTRRAAKLSPKDSRFAIKVVEILRRLGRNQEGWMELQSAIDRFPTDLYLQLTAAKMAFDFGEVEVALRHFGLASRIGKIGAEANRTIARCLASLGREEEAKGFLRKAIDEEGDVEAMGFLGYMLQAEGEFEEARALFLRAIQIAPDQGTAYHGYAQSHRFTGADRSFVESLLKQLESGALSDPDRMTLEYVAGKALEDLGTYDESFNHYERANALAFQINLNGHAFDPVAHRRFFELTRSHYPPEVLTSPSYPPNTGPTPIFVVGMMRAGTSLLEQILSSHPEIAGAGELAFWPDHHRDAFDFRNLPSLRAAYLADISARGHGARWVVDKMPQNYQSLGAIHLALPEAPIIHIRRDPMDTCLSIYTTAYAMSPDFAHDLHSIRAAYEEYLRMMDYWRANLPVIEISYEELVRDRESVLRGLVEKSGIPWSDALLAHEQNSRSVATPSVWQVRQPLYTGSIERWRRFKDRLQPLIGI